VHLALAYTMTVVIFLLHYNIRRKHFYYTILNCRLFDKNCMRVFLISVSSETSDEQLYIGTQLNWNDDKWSALALVITNVTKKKKGGRKLENHSVLTHIYIMLHRDLLYTAADYNMFMTGVRKSWSSRCRTNEFRAFIYILYKTTNGRL